MKLYTVLLKNDATLLKTMRPGNSPEIDDSQRFDREKEVAMIGLEPTTHGL